MALEHHPNGPLADLLWVPASSCHGSNLSRVVASKKPGAVQAFPCGGSAPRLGIKEPTAHQPTTHLQILDEA